MPYRVYVFYVGHVNKSILYETLFHCNIPSKHHHHTGVPLKSQKLVYKGVVLKVILWLCCSVISVAFYYLCGYLSLCLIDPRG
jgi:hypothetical protein